VIEIGDTENQAGAGFLHHAKVDQPQFPALGLRHDSSSSRSFIAKISDDANTICRYSSNHLASSDNSALDSRSIAPSISTTVFVWRKLPFAAMSGNSIPRA
jgi:hypothetical protein